MKIQIALVNNQPYSKDMLWVFIAINLMAIELVVLTGVYVMSSRMRSFTPEFLRKFTKEHT